METDAPIQPDTTIAPTATPHLPTTPSSGTTTGVVLPTTTGLVPPTTGIVLPPATTTSDTFTWQWQSDGGWMVYDKESVKILEEAFSLKLPSIQLNLKGGASGGFYTINFDQLIQINDDTLNERSVRRILTNEVLLGDDEEEDEEDLFVIDTATTPTISSSLSSSKTESKSMTTDIKGGAGGSKPVWEWFNDSVWRAYDEETNAIMEEAYSRKSPTVPLTHGYFGESGGYTIDFSGMSQIRDSSGYSRQIRRIPHAEPIPGSALRTKAKQKPQKTYHQPEVVHCDPSIMAELQAALHLFSNKQSDVEEVPVIEIIVDDD